jgi:hypothetical protein
MVFDFINIIKFISFVPAVGIGSIAGLGTGLGITALKNIIFYNGNMSSAGPYDWHTAPLWYICTVAGGLASGYLVYMA